MSTNSISSQNFKSLSSDGNEIVYNKVKNNDSLKEQAQEERDNNLHQQDKQSQGIEKGKMNQFQEGNYGGNSDPNSYLNAFPNISSNFEKHIPL